MCFTLNGVMKHERKLTNFRLDADLLEGMHALRERDGVPIAETMRRALRAWLGERGVLKTKSAPKRAQTRRGA